MWYEKISTIILQQLSYVGQLKLQVAVLGTHIPGMFEVCRTIEMLTPRPTRPGLVPPRVRDHIRGRYSGAWLRFLCSLPHLPQTSGSLKALAACMMAFKWNIEGFFLL